MAEDFPFLEVPPWAQEALGGEPDPGTRFYRAEGPEEGSGPWFEVVTAIAGPCVSPGGAVMFAPVTRGAVQRRIAEGKLTTFTYYVTSTRIGLFGAERKTREFPYVYIPASELKAWASELEKRIVKLGRISQDELEKRKPDWDREDFWEFEAKWRMERLNKLGRKGKP